ncbi:hypothetical protein T439DRAFT_347627 [Meredithblackwellia eburnea MCA 4105]
MSDSGDSLPHFDILLARQRHKTAAIPARDLVLDDHQRGSTASQENRTKEEGLNPKEGKSSQEVEERSKAQGGRPPSPPQSPSEHDVSLSAVEDSEEESEFWKYRDWVITSGTKKTEKENDQDGSKTPKVQKKGKSRRSLMFTFESDDSASENQEPCPSTSPSLHQPRPSPRKSTIPLVASRRHNLPASPRGPFTPGPSLQQKSPPTKRPPLSSSSSFPTPELKAKKRITIVISSSSESETSALSGPCETKGQLPQPSLSISNAAPIFPSKFCTPPQHENPIRTGTALDKSKGTGRKVQTLVVCGSPDRESLSEGEETEDHNVVHPKTSNSTLKTPTGRSKMVVPDSPGSDSSAGGDDFLEDEEVGPNEGILTYEPTPRGKRPIKLLTPKLPLTGSSSGSTRTIPTPGRSKLGIEVDLTGSSSDSSEDSEAELPTFKSVTKPPHSLSTLSRPPPPTLTQATKRGFTTAKSRTSTPQTPKMLNNATRASLPIDLMRMLDKTVFRKRWDGMRVVEGEGEGLPEGIEIVWNRRLANTAGRASWKKITSGGRVQHKVTIDLATKVTDTEDKLRKTLSHELCHVAAWVLDGEIKPSHGPAFKTWAKRITSLHQSIEISTTHNYEIAYKYRWKCSFVSCGKIFGRHSKSIDPSKHGCLCGGSLLQIDKDGVIKVPRLAPGTPAKKSGWHDFVADMSPKIRLDNPRISQSDILKICGERWRSRKAGNDEALVEGLRDLDV